MYGKKIIYLAVIINLCCGCGVAQKKFMGADHCKNQCSIIENTLKNNLTYVGFYIQKGKIIIKEGSKKISLLYSVKYAREEKYLISLRDVSGAEAMRIYIDTDTLLVNNRINREFLSGSNTEFERITGVPAEFLKVCFGDLPEYNLGAGKKTVTENQGWEVSGYYKGIRFVAVIDCGVTKVKKIALYTGVDYEHIDIMYRKFDGEIYKIPREIIMYDSGKKVKIELRNNRYIVPWYGDIEFIPGTGYRKSQLNR